MYFCYYFFKKCVFALSIRFHGKKSLYIKKLFLFTFVLPFLANLTCAIADDNIINLRLLAEFI